MELFYFPECPFCNRVRQFMAQKSIELPLLNAHEPENAEKLRGLGGKLQVPALLHDEEILYESSDIIDYLNNLS